MTNRNQTAAVELVIETLAVFRATKLLQQDDLPPLPEIREKLMARFEHSPWSMLIDCPWCLSVWVAGGSRLLRAVAPRLWRVLATVLASSAVAGVISEWLATKELPGLTADVVDGMERAARVLQHTEDDRLR